jgi:protoheme IX farnesyltransferase
MNAGDFLELTKPRVTWLILVSSAVGYYFGASHGWNLVAFLNTLLGTGLMASGTAALNQWYERDADLHMKRTEKRPIPSRRVKPAQAFWFGIAVSLLGFLQLLMFVNHLTAALCMTTLILYLCLYTPLKRKTWLSTTLGAIPGAMPPLIGFAGAADRLTPEAWAVGAILFLWQFPHFYAIAWMYRDDYARAGIRMLPVVEPDGKSTARQIILYAALLVPISLLPIYLHMSGMLYLAGALILGTWFLWSGIQVFRTRTRLQARKVLLTSVIYLPLLYALMVLDPYVI